MADLFVIEELRAYLIAQGIAQAQSAAPSLTVPSIWLQPRDGAPLPRKAADTYVEAATITLTDITTGQPSVLEEWVTQTFVDVVVRARTAQPGKLIHRRIEELLVPYDGSQGRRQWMMNNLLVESSTLFRGDQPLPQLRRVAENDPHATFDRVASYRFVARRKILAGLTIP